MARKKSDYSVAPKERINIVYRPATAGRKEQVELPLKVMVLGDFTQKQDARDLEDRDPVDVDESNFDEVLASMDVSTHFSVPDKVSGEEGKSMEVDLRFEKMSDFEPGHVIESVPELRRMLELREALKALKGPLGNVPEMRRKIQEIIQDDRKSAKLMQELGIG
jgi:type VI secretion system protein ImpB